MKRYNLVTLAFIPFLVLAIWMERYDAMFTVGALVIAVVMIFRIVRAFGKLRGNE